MKLSDFNYDLPTELIAQDALQNRTSSRLLHLDTTHIPALISDKKFTDILDLIHPDDLLVFNNTRVIPARLYGHKESGGKVEVMVERLLDTHRVLAHVRANKSPKPQTKLLLEGHIEGLVVGRQERLFEIEFNQQPPILELLEAHGHIPLPPYIDRADTVQDKERYQTIFARKAGAVAAPTAGVHFNQNLLNALLAKGIQTAQVTLHVGAGTFLPVSTENLAEHVMHAEWVEVEQSVCDAVKACKNRGGKVIAVGTTSVRSLESAAQSTGALQPFSGDTRLFITPGYQFNVVDAIITNFHLPQSTLLMLVAAFSGYDNIMSAYQHAVNQQYRFFSYGDAMFLEKNTAL